MHHVPPPQWTRFVAEMFRVIRTGGLALVFEHNPYNPATQYIVKTCDIDKDAVLLRPGKLRGMFVDAGFGKAWWTIVDTHVTTVVSCAFLFIFGSGPVKGFAVTLLIGLIANVFTAVFVSRTIFEYELSGRRQLTELSI